MYASRACCSLYQLFQASDFALTSLIFLLQPFCTNKIESPSCQRTHLLKINSISGDNCFIGFVVIFAFASSLCSRALNLLSPRIKVSFICILTNLKAYIIIITKRQGLYNKVVIYSFFSNIYSIQPINKFQLLIYYIIISI